jgi:myo-inositol-1(or 4)-monophosphatase
MATISLKASTDVATGSVAVKSSPTLLELKTLAIQAGEILKEGYGQEHDIQLKGVNDLVTEMDQRAEDYLLGQIRPRYPDHSIVTEESGTINGKEKACWYIDPLDGTTNYAHHLPFFSVSLAYAEGGQIRFGVIYEPMRQECFSAERGGGAWLNGAPIHVSSSSELIKSLLVTGFPYLGKGNLEKNLEYYSRFTMLTQGVRRLGSAALDLCYLAAGRVDGYWEISLKPWDLAAGVLIAAEAGAVVTSIHGDPEVMQSPYSVLAANPDLHSLMLDILR